MDMKIRILSVSAAAFVVALSSGCGLMGNPSADSGHLTAKQLDMQTVRTANAGDRIDVSIDRLAKKEHYTIRIDSIVIDSGKANRDGEVYTRVKVPESLHSGKHLITATGELPNRKDTDRIRIKRNEHVQSLKIDLEESVSPGGNQKVKIYRLLEDEGVRVLYDGTQVSPSGAAGNDDGRYTITFPVGNTLGTHKVKAIGDYNGRSKTKEFDVEN